MDQEDIPLIDEEQAAREAHAEMVTEMMLAKECDEYDCGQDDYPDSPYSSSDQEENLE